MYHEYLNGSVPGMLSAHRNNGDLRLPLRFPIVSGTHCCGDDTCMGANDSVIVAAAQIAQDAQAGYAIDCTMKRAADCF